MSVAALGLFVQSFAGFAGSLVAIPLLSLFLSPREAVPAYQFTMLFIDLWLVYESRQHVQWNRLGILLVGGLSGVPIGVYCLKNFHPHVIGIAISCVTLLFAILFMMNVRLQLNEKPVTKMGVGLLSGILGGSISESGPPVVIYALSRNWEKEIFRSTLLSYFTCLCILGNICFLLTGLTTRQSVALGAASLIPALLASLLGIRLKNFVNEIMFRRVVLGIIIAVSIIGLARHAGGF